MRSLTRRGRRSESNEDKPLAARSDRELERTIRQSVATIESLPDRPPHAAMSQLIARAEAAAARRAEAVAELERRRAPGFALERALANTGGHGQHVPSSKAAAALHLVAAFGHSELEGEQLVAGRLSESEAEELGVLAQRRRDGGASLSALELERYEQLVGQAAGAPELFARRRDEQAIREKLAEYRRSERRLPQAESLVAAVLADASVWDDLHERFRADVVEVDEHGHERTGSSCRLLELADIGVLCTLLNLIVANGGNEVTAGQHGFLGPELPFVPMTSLAQLRRNGYLTTRRDGSDWLVGPGPRVRQIASRWGIVLPDAEGGPTS